MIAIRKLDGTLSGPYNATRGTDDYHVVLDAPLDFIPTFAPDKEPPFYQFGPATRWHFPALVTDINPSSTDTVSVKAVNYDERVYADDDSTAPST